MLTKLAKPKLARLLAPRHFREKSATRGCTDDARGWFKFDWGSRDMVTRVLDESGGKTLPVRGRGHQKYTRQPTEWPMIL